MDVLSDTDDLSFVSGGGAGRPEKTDGYGEYTGTLSSSVVAGHFGVAFVVGPMDQEVAAVWDVNVLPGTPYSVHLTTSNATAVHGTRPAGPLVATVTDSDGNPCPEFP